MSGIYISDERGLKLIYGNKTARGNILKEIEDASLEDDQGEGTQSVIDISIPPDAPLDETAENQIPADIIYLDNHFCHVFLGRPGERCLTRRCSLILERGLSLTREQFRQKARFRLRGSFFEEEGRRRVCFHTSSSASSHQQPPPPVTTASLLHRLSLTLIPPSVFFPRNLFLCSLTATVGSEVGGLV